jgi:hypothetical protein
LNAKKAGCKKVECEEIEPIQRNMKFHLPRVKIWEKSGKTLKFTKVGCKDIRILNEKRFKLVQ